MIQYYGWIRVDFDEDEDEISKRELIEKIDQFLKKIYSTDRILVRRMINGYKVINLAGIRNHYCGEVEDIISLFNYIASITPLSFGNLSIIEEKDEDLIHSFQLKNGKFNFKKELFNR